MKKCNHLPSFHDDEGSFMVVKLPKKVHCLQFCADLNKKSKSIKAIYIFAPERSRYAFSENGFVHYAMIYCFGDIRV